MRSTHSERHLGALLDTERLMHAASPGSAHSSTQTLPVGDSHALAFRDSAVHLPLRMPTPGKSSLTASHQSHLNHSLPLASVNSDSIIPSPPVRRRRRPGASRGA